jgi:hypothetical protein
MADIKFRGFVEKHEGNRPWTVAEGHSRKDENDRWQTTARTFHKVWLPKGHPGLSEGDLVEVTGSQKTNVSEYQGQKRFDLVVYANEVEVVRANQPRLNSSSQPQTDAWATDDSTPF